MNNQIKLLAKQAGAFERNVCHGHGDYRNEYQLTDESIDVFAELIIKECFDIVIRDGRFHDAKGILKAGKGVAMEHFGVQE